MYSYLRGILPLGLLFALFACTTVFAAPERLGDEVPDATPDMPRSLNFAYNYESLDLEGALENHRTSVNSFKLRYTFSPKVAIGLKHQRSDLSGGLGLITPLYDNMDSANAFTVDVGLNLMNEPAVAADPGNNVAWAAGSAFGLGFSGTFYELDADALSQKDQLLKMYLVYTTDLSEEMTAHTVFSSSRVSGDTHTGSVNRVGIGLDYKLIDGQRPLTLMADGIIDIYNFREPSFNTSRVSRFNLGMRYRVMEDLYASIGWSTLNDSENDASGSGIFASINYVDMPSWKKSCDECPDEPEAQPEAPPQATAPTASNLQMASAGTVEQPLLMTTNLPPADLTTPDIAAGLKYCAGDCDDETLRQLSSVADPSENGTYLADAGLTGSPTGLKYPEIATSIPSLRDPEGYGDQYTSERETASIEDNGIAIPPFPSVTPLPTPDGAVMVRAGQPMDNASTKSLSDLMAIALTDAPAAEKEAVEPKFVRPQDETGTGETGSSSSTETTGSTESEEE